jgi:MurNAc alpha-1-phosphate uridylyltransferase
MAAGKGTRLRPFTDNNPKPLIKVGGISLIERNILKLKEHNISEVVINLHHFGEKIIDLLGEGSNYGLKISYSLEKDLLGTGGGICNSIHHFDDPFIVLSSDTWTDFDFNKLRLKEGHLAHMIMIPNPKNNTLGDAALIDGLINLESDINKYTFSGVSILSPKLFHGSKVIESELWKDFLKPAAAKGLVSGEVYEGLFENLNTMDDVERLDASLGEE